MRSRVTTSHSRLAVQRRWDAATPGATIGRELSSVCGVYTCLRESLVLLRSALQCFAHRIRVIERQRCGAARAQHVGERLRVLDLQVAERDVVVGHERGAGDQQRHRHREHDHVDDFPPDRQIAQQLHGLTSFRERFLPA